MALKILHTSDVHLGAKLGYLGEKASAHRKQIEKTFETSVQLAIDQAVDLFLIAGDLFDSPYPSKANIALVINQIGKLIEAGIYVAIIPGNHDRLEQGSVFFRPEFSNLKSHNLKIFIKNTPEQWYINALDTTIHGVAIVQQKSKRSPLEGLQGDENSKYNIGLVHGSVDIISEPDNYPIYKEQIEKLNIDYLALGDWHSCLDINPKQPVCWYSGSPELINVSQRGSGNVLLVTVSEDNVEVEKKPVGEMSVVEHKIALNKYLNVDQIVEELEVIQNKQVVLGLTVSGLKKLDFDGELADLPEKLADKFFHVRVKEDVSLMLSKDELDQYPPEFVTGKFIRNLQSQKGQNKNENEIIDLAIQLGVKMLRGEYEDK